MKRIFLATSFSGKVNTATGEVLPEFRSEIEAVLAALRAQPGVTVFCAMEDEGWKNSLESPDKGVRTDTAAVDAADLLVAVLQGQLSSGVQFEVGYAVAKGKQVVLAAHTDQALDYLSKGVVAAGYATLATYDSPEALAAQLLSAS